MRQPNPNIEKMREEIRAMLGAMDMSYNEAADVFGVNKSSLGYMLDTKKVAPLHEKVKKRYEEYQKEV